MADEMSTLALNVDLDCHPCYQKMRKALCKFPEIEIQKFDEEQKKVIISGPFEPEKLIKKLYCKVGCKIIKGYVIVVTTTAPTPPPPPPKKEQLKPPKPESKPESKPDKPPSKPMPLVPGPVNIVIGPIGPVCTHRPFQLPDYPIPVDCKWRPRNPTCHCNGSHGNCQCGCGGHSHPCESRGNCQCGCGRHSPPRDSQDNCQCGCRVHLPSHGFQGNCQCGCGGQSGCRFMIEEESNCTIM